MRDSDCIGRRITLILRRGYPLERGEGTVGFVCETEFSTWPKGRS